MNTSNGKIRKWVNKVISTIASPEVALPIFVHFTSGKDRTGVIVAAILKALDIDDKHIINEYMLSEGVEGPNHIQNAIKGFYDIHISQKRHLARLT